MLVSSTWIFTINLDRIHLQCLTKKASEQIYHVWEGYLRKKKQSRDEQFPEPKGEGNLISRLVYFANTPPKHDISV